MGKKVPKASHSMHRRTEIMGSAFYKAVRGELDYDYEREVGNQILSTLKEIEEGRICRCPNCGGIVPDIHIHTGQRTFCLTCTKVTNKEGKVIAETDFKKLEKYAHDYNMRQRMRKCKTGIT